MVLYNGLSDTSDHFREVINLVERLRDELAGNDVDDATDTLHEIESAARSGLELSEVKP